MVSVFNLRCIQTHMHVLPFSVCEIYISGQSGFDSPPGNESGFDSWEKEQTYVPLFVLIEQLVPDQ